MRFGLVPARTADRNEVGSFGSDSRSAGCSPLMASSISARSSTVRAIGPCTLTIRASATDGVEATRPTLGRMPTMPQKLAGLRNEPPMSEPCAIQAVPLAIAAAAPPEEPAADFDKSQGFRVAPNTSLKVLAPAPNSGVFDLA